MKISKKQVGFLLAAAWMLFPLNELTARGSGHGGGHGGGGHGGGHASLGGGHHSGRSHMSGGHLGNFSHSSFSHTSRHTGNWNHGLNHSLNRGLNRGLGNQYHPYNHPYNHHHDNIDGLQWNGDPQYNIDVTPNYGDSDDLMMDTDDLDLDDINPLDPEQDGNPQGRLE